MSRSEQLRQLAARLASLATLGFAVAHGVQALLEVPQESVALLPAAGPVPGTGPAFPFALSLPQATPGRPRGSILLSQRGPTGLSVKSCPVSSHRCSGSSASAAYLVEPGSAAGAASASAPSVPRAAMSAARLASRGRPSGAAKARRRKRDKHRRRTQRHSKRSVWREI